MAVDLKHHRGVSVSKHLSNFRELIPASKQVIRDRLTQRVGTISSQSRFSNGGCPVLMDSSLIQGSTIDGREDQTLFLPCVSGSFALEVLPVAMCGKRC